MGRFANDMNKVVLLHESGTYANTSGNGYWLGQVISNNITENENKIMERHMGTASRTLSSVEKGPLDVDGTLTYRPQDHRLPFWALGSVIDVSGTNYEHTAVEIASDVRQSAFTSGTLNPPISFSLEDSKQAPGTGKNFIRTVKGCVIDTVRIIAAQGEKNTIEANYVGKQIPLTSGASTAVTEITTTPYLWSDTSLVLSGSTLLTPTEITLEINRNATSPHYVNNEREASSPYQSDQDYTLNVTMDLNSDDAVMLYQKKQNNEAFNGIFKMSRDSSTGSQTGIYTLSGCYVVSMDPPSEAAGGVASTNVEIRPMSVTGKAYDKVPYNPW